MRTCLQIPFLRSQIRSVVSREPEIAVFASDIFKHRTVDVCPRSVNWGCLMIVSRVPNMGYVMEERTLWQDSTLAHRDRIHR
jgi:hypothetical protein